MLIEYQAYLLELLHPSLLPQMTQTQPLLPAPDLRTPPPIPGPQQRRSKYQSGPNAGNTRTPRCRVSRPRTSAGTARHIHSRQHQPCSPCACRTPPCPTTRPTPHQAISTHPNQYLPTHSPSRHASRHPHHPICTRTGGPKQHTHLNRAPTRPLPPRIRPPSRRSRAWPPHKPHSPTHGRPNVCRSHRPNTDSNGTSHV
jgi:hypothetical protein